MILTRQFLIEMNQNQDECMVDKTSQEQLIFNLNRKKDELKKT